MYKYIGILTDFGLKDPYVGIMKSVILKINPVVRLIDISHDIPSFSIRAAAYVLLVSKEYFPKNTIFLVVVDPGVGSERRALVVKTRRFMFVGPDNGVLYPAIINDGIIDIRLIDNEKLFIKPISHTFHGRDIFAPIAALLSKGLSLDVVGKSINVSEIVKMDIKMVELERIKVNEKICSEVVYIDKFGNVTLGIRMRDYNTLPCGKIAKIEINGRMFKAYVSRAFSLVKPGDLALYVNSFRFIEIGVNMGNAVNKLNVDIGDEICLEILGV